MQEQFDERLNLNVKAAAIIREIEQGEKTQNQIAKDYGVSRQHVSYLKTRYAKIESYKKKKDCVLETLKGDALTEQEVAQKCGCSVVYVKRIKRETNNAG